MMKSIRILFIIFLISFFASASFAKMYKWKDKDGVWVFSNVSPPDNIDQEVQQDYEVQSTKSIHSSPSHQSQQSSNKITSDCKKLRYYKIQLSDSTKKLAEAKNNLGPRPMTALRSNRAFVSEKTADRIKKYSKQKFEIGELESRVKHNQKAFNEYKKKCK